MKDCESGKIRPAKNQIEYTESQPYEERHKVQVTERKAEKTNDRDDDTINQAL